MSVLIKEFRDCLKCSCTKIIVTAPPNKVSMAQLPLTNYKKRLLSNVTKRMLRDEDEDGKDADEDESECMMMDCDDDIDAMELTDSESESSDSDSEFSSENDEPMYDNEESSNVNEEAVLMILSFYLRHNLTWQALGDLLQLFNELRRMNVTKLPNSKYLFRKALPPVDRYITHYYCKRCGAYVGEESDLLVSFPSKDVQCSNCLYEFPMKSKTKAAFFLQLKIEPQLRRVVNKFSNHICCTSDVDGINYVDVTSGTYYKSVKKAVPNLISLTLNTDGVNIFKSKKGSSLWPLQMVVNEIPPQERFKKEHVIVAGLWYGNDPDMNFLFQNFVQEVHTINEKGVLIKSKNQTVSFNVRVLLLAADSPARAKVLNQVLFNGFYGCMYCLHPGSNRDRNNIVTAMRYPYCRHIQRRSHEEVKTDEMDCERQRQSGAKCNDIRGIKGPTPLLLLTDFDVVKGIPVDCMHACLHGVTAKLLGLWLDQENHLFEFYIGQPAQVECINNRIRSIRLSSVFPRRPRPVDDRAYWKASELFTFLLHYGGVCLDGILPEKYVKHFQMFSSAIFLLNGSSITSTDIAKATKLLDNFLISFPKLYGPENEVFNVHLVSHIVESVVESGPLWCYTTFAFESFNGVLKSLVNGTTDVLVQIATKFLMHSADLTRRFHRSTHRNKSISIDGVLLFGSGMTTDAKMWKMTIAMSEQDIAVAKFYKSCMINGQVIKIYCDKGECDDSIIRTTKDDFYRVMAIAAVKEKVFFWARKLRVATNNSSAIDSTDFM